MADIVVSVIVITYNHSQYIRQCLDSILMQKTSFPFEVLVGDDCSTDDTQEILREYLDKYPNIFRMELREENLGPTKNAYELFFKARGKYLAHCEGDDYWTDENKLQLQFEIMEKMPGLSACTHEVDWVNGLGFEIKPQYEYYDSNSLVTVNMWDGIKLLGQTNTFFEKNRYLDNEHNYSVYLSHSISGDLCIELFMLLSGNVFVIPNKMAAYRRIVKKNGDNAISRLYSDPKFSINFYDYWMKLEKYCREEFNIKKDFPAPKKAHFIAQIDKATRTKKKEDIQGVFYLLKVSDRKIQYIGILTKWICKKLLLLPKHMFKFIRRRIHNDILKEFFLVNQKITQIDRKYNRILFNTNVTRAFLLRQEEILISLMQENGIPLPETMIEILENREKEKEKNDRKTKEKIEKIEQKHKEQLIETLEKYDLPPMPKEGCMLSEEERLAAKERVYLLLTC